MGVPAIAPCPRAPDAVVLPKFTSSGLAFRWRRLRRCPSWVRVPDGSAAGVRQPSQRTSIQEAATVFGDPLAVTFQDPDHSFEEERQLTFGQSLQRRLIVVSHTRRGERTRIINARLMDRNERVIYEEG